MKLRTSWLGIAVCFLTFVSAAAHADGLGHDLGIMMGASHFQSFDSTHFTMGVDGHRTFLALPGVRMGAFIGVTFLDSQAGTGIFPDGSVVRGTITRTMLHLDFSLKYDIPVLKGLSVGIRPGLVYDSERFSSKSGASGSVPNSSKLGLEFGPTLGYDLKITDSVAIALDLSYNWISFDPSWSYARGMIGVRITE